MFFDALDETLLKRFSEAQRPHPLTRKDRDLQEAINLESKTFTVLPIIHITLLFACWWIIKYATGLLVSTVFVIVTFLSADANNKCHKNKQF